MKITYLGHAGLYIETEFGSILCDPWFNPAYFASWFPFPDNSGIDPSSIGTPDYLYISHLHRDHLDAKFLTEHVDKSAKVLLPDYPMDHLERELRSIGFKNFVKMKNGVPLGFAGGKLVFTIFADVSHTESGCDSGIIIDDGTARIYNQNDSHPKNLDEITELGPFDAHFVQFSGAIWYPMVYDFPTKVKRKLAIIKRENQISRALAFIEAIGAKNVFPSAGPPCFLDPELFHLNDFGNDPANIFMDQLPFIRHLNDLGWDNAWLIVPQSEIQLIDGGCATLNPTYHYSAFSKKREYLEEYRARRLVEISAEKQSWPSQGRILASLKEWFEPLLAEADALSAGVNGRVLLDCGKEKIVIDFLTRKVYAHNGENCRYKFEIYPRIVRTLIENHEEDWINSVFLSCRFKADRDGPYNSYVYAFFACLSLERLRHLEEHYAATRKSDELIEVDGYIIQRRCPHLQADLSHFGTVLDGVLTCSMHGWQFELATGKCLTSDDRKLISKKIE